ncbi:hypothetical protein [Haloechinothrix sp. LS1_15]|uniref:hypothetical protein n=1 Tax=Haloechinothrix sp. LS1_15 TaxID=2652248 RepID=UPI0029475426|nr:hypothetical protein [Haloechinothrix sp. LS1_15]MDV6012220.1 hypothetical protein [Haloechinothrix sp. LS1_15]
MLGEQDPGNGSRACHCAAIAQRLAAIEQRVERLATLAGRLVASVDHLAEQVGCDTPPETSDPESGGAPQ